MDANKTCLSAGEIIRAILVENDEVMKRAGKVYPVVEDSAELPYVVYRRANLHTDPVKGRKPADTVSIEILCYTAHYTEGVELAEAVRDALDGVSGESDGIIMRSCYLEDSEEAWQDDAYVQQLVFNVKI